MTSEIFAGFLNNTAQHLNDEETHYIIYDGAPWCILIFILHFVNLCHILFYVCNTRTESQHFFEFMIKVILCRNLLIY